MQQTANLIDLALPGGAAPAKDAAAIADAIAATKGLRVHPHRAFLLWVLVLLRQWTGVWQAAAKAGVLVQHEASTKAALAAAAGDLRDMTEDPDPEVRSMAYRLVGSASNDAAAITFLRSAAVNDPNPLARACAVEAAFVAMIVRWPDVPSGDVDWLRGLADGGEPTTRGRIRQVLEGEALAQSRPIAAEILPIEPGSLPAEGVLWPAEAI